MKYIILIPLLLTACISEQQVSNTINEANRKCKDKGGVESLYAENHNNCVIMTFMCSNGDGTTYTISSKFSSYICHK